MNSGLGERKERTESQVRTKLHYYLVTFFWLVKGQAGITSEMATTTPTFQSHITVLFFAKYCAIFENNQ